MKPPVLEIVKEGLRIDLCNLQEDIAALNISGKYVEHEMLGAFKQLYDSVNNDDIIESTIEKGNAFIRIIEKMEPLEY